MVKYIKKGNQYLRAKGNCVGVRAVARDTPPAGNSDNWLRHNSRLRKPVQRRRSPKQRQPRPKWFSSVDLLNRRVDDVESHASSFLNVIVLKFVTVSIIDNVTARMQNDQEHHFR